MQPEGYCQCGCGQKTRVPDKDHKQNGWKKGVPLRYVNGHNGRKAPEPYRIDEATGCWLWQWAANGQGYGVIEGRMAHRAMWQERHGPLPRDIDLHHLCETPLCVNPAHMQPLSRAEHKRRHVSSLTPEDVRVIRATPHTYGSRRGLARKYGVTDAAISGIRAGTTWRDVQ